MRSITVRVLVVVGLVGALTTNAAAQEAPPPTVESGEESFFPDPATRPRPRPAPPQAFQQQERRKLRPRITPPETPPDDVVDDCLSKPGADTVNGRVHNRFLWCIEAHAEPYAERRNPPFPPTRTHQATVNFQIVAYGRDDGERNIRVYLRATSATADLAAFPGNTVVRLWADCASLTDVGCGAGGETVAQTVADWDRDKSWHTWTINSSDNIDTVDKRRTHEWVMKSSARFDVGETRIDDSPERRIRCDSATYFPGRRAACVFDEVKPHLQYFTSKPEHDEVAEHILRAQRNPRETWPNHGTDKDIPGEFPPGDDDRALHRAPYRKKPPLNDDTHDKNARKKTQACNRQGDFTGDKGLPADRYDTSKGQECDEYPFASTYEGANSDRWDFSVDGVSKEDNGCAGTDLKFFYVEDRILYGDNDRFWVQIHDDNDISPPPGCGEDPGEEFEEGSSVAARVGGVGFTADPPSGGFPVGGDVTVALRVTDPDAEPAVFLTEVDWGDGTTTYTTGTTPTAHRYTEPGTYTIRTEVSDGEGSTLASTMTAVVAAPPTSTSTSTSTGTTSTRPATTTTGPGATTTTRPVTTTTGPGATTTTAPGPTTTTRPETTTTGGPSTTTPPDELPATGDASAPLAALAVVLIGAGLAVLAHAGRRRRQELR